MNRCRQCDVKDNLVVLLEVCVQLMVLIVFYPNPPGPGARTKMPKSPTVPTNLIPMLE